MRFGRFQYEKISATGDEYVIATAASRTCCKASGGRRLLDA